MSRFIYIQSLFLTKGFLPLRYEERCERAVSCAVCNSRNGESKLLTDVVIMYEGVVVMDCKIMIFCSLITWPEFPRGWGHPNFRLNTAAVNWAHQLLYFH